MGKYNKKLKSYSCGFIAFLTVMLTVNGLSASGEISAPDPLPQKSLGEIVKISGYGNIYYTQFTAFDRNQERDWRKEADLERFVLKVKADPRPWLELVGEVEYEHGGTGSTMELDELEEFGEFETEIEAGGEIIVEELYMRYKLFPWLNIRAGHFKLPVGILPYKNKPGSHATVVRSEMEETLLPATWHETGIEIHGKLGPVNYRGAVVNGLDSTGFSSANWIKNGHQRRFERVKAEDLAVTGRLDFDFTYFDPVREYFEEAVIGVSGYHGDSAKNRPKQDLKKRMLLGIDDFGSSPDIGSAKVTVKSAHIITKGGPVGFRAMYLYGNLENADQVTYYNRKLSNALGVKRTTVASGAEGWYYELSYDILSHFTERMSLDLYVRYDYADSMAHIDKVTDKGNELYNQEYAYDDPRWQRRTKSAGFAFRPDPMVSIKGQYSRRTIGSGPLGIKRVWGHEYDIKEDAYYLAMGFEF